MQTYSNCNNIRVDGSYWKTVYHKGLGHVFAALHEQDVLELLGTMAQTWTGYDLFMAIYNEGIRAHRRIIIVPYTLKDRTQGPNAYSSADNVRAAAPAGGINFQGGGDDLTTPEDDRYVTIGKGTGGGSSTHVHFSTDTTFSGGPGSKLDEILFHELVHSMREMQGEEQSIPMGPKDVGYDNDE